MKARISPLALPIAVIFLTGILLCSACMEDDDLHFFDAGDCDRLCQKLEHCNGADFYDEFEDIDECAEGCEDVSGTEIQCMLECDESADCAVYAECLLDC